MVNITPIFKKGSKNKKENFRPVIILPVLTKIFEKLRIKQLSTFFENTLSKFQCGFRKGYSTLHCLLLMLEKWKFAVDNNEAYAALFNRSLKSFQLSTNCEVAFLWFLVSISKITKWYLSNRKQRIKVKNVSSKWQNIETGVP